MSQDDEHATYLPVMGAVLSRAVVGDRRTVGREGGVARVGA
jgi:hypothetical protein